MSNGESSDPRPEAAESAARQVTYVETRPTSANGLAVFATALRRYWLSALAVLLIVVGGTAAFSLLQTPTYESKSQVLVAPQVGGDVYQTASTRLPTYTAMVTSPEVMTQVVRQLGLHESASQVADSISAGAVTDTSILTITASSDDARQAQQLSDATTQAFIAFVTQTESTMMDPGQASKFSVIDQAAVPASPASPNLKLNLVAAVLLGLLLASAVALARQSLAAARTPVAG